MNAGEKGAGEKKEAMTGVTTAEQWWERFFRHGPYGLLGLASVVSAVTSGLIMSRADVYAAAVLVPAALGLQLLWSRAPAEQGSRAAQCYFIVRTLLAFGLTWCNPFFSIYAVLGYFDSRGCSRNGACAPGCWPPPSSWRDRSPAAACHPSPS